jgi:hypothetical protein
MTQFTCKGVKQINNRISFKHLYHSYLSAFFISAGVPNGEFPEILIAKCRSRFYCTWFCCWGEIVQEINVSRAWDPVNTGDKALTRDTPAQRGRVNRYGIYWWGWCVARGEYPYLTSVSNPLSRRTILYDVSYMYVEQWCFYIQCCAISPPHPQPRIKILYTLVRLVHTTKI